MPQYICKLGDDEYFIWSTIVDAPVTYAMTREELDDFYKEEYGRRGLVGLPGRMIRVENVGTSAYGYKSVREVVECNRAGPNGTELTFDELCVYLRSRGREEISS